MSKIKSIKKERITTEKLYNLSVDTDESFIANGIVVHNCKSWIKPILVGRLGNREPSKATPSAAAIDSLKFAEYFQEALLKAMIEKPGLSV